MSKKTRLLMYMYFLMIAFSAIIFLHFPTVSANTLKNDVNVYFFPDGQKHSTVNVDVVIVASTTDPGGFTGLRYEWWYSNPRGEDYPLTDEEGNVVSKTITDAVGKSVVKFNASNFADRGGVPVTVAGKYYVKVYSYTNNGEKVSTSLLYNLRKDTAGRVEIIEITDENPKGNVGYVWIKINYAGLYTGNESTITSKVYKIGETGEWQKYEGQFKITENTTIYAEYTDGIRTLSTSYTITSIDSKAPVVEIDYENQDYENPIVKVFEDTSGIEQIKYGWVKYVKNSDGTLTKDSDGITLWRYVNVEGYPTGQQSYQISIDKLNDVQGDGIYKLHVIAKDRVGNTSEEVISSEYVYVDRLGPQVAFDDRGIPQSQSYYEIIVNVDESDLGELNGKKELYFFMLPSGQSPYPIVGYDGDNPIYDFSDYNSALMANVYDEIALDRWATRDKDGNIVIRISPEYFSPEQIELFDELITLYVKAVDEHGNYTLASTEIRYHTTYLLPKTGRLFVNANNDDWPFQIKYAQIALVPEFSSYLREVFRNNDIEYNKNTLEVYYTLNYSLSTQDIDSFNSLFIDYGDYKVLKDFESYETWIANGGWLPSIEYLGGYYGNITPREMRITANTNDKVVRVMLVDRSTGLVELYDSYEFRGEVRDLKFNNIDNTPPTISVSSNWNGSQTIGKSVVVNLEVTDDHGFTKTSVVQYQWTNFGVEKKDQLSNNWLSFTPKRVSTIQPTKLYTYPDSLIKTVGDGKDYLWIRVVDSVGNETITVQKFVLDTTAPTIDLRVRNTNKALPNEYLTEDEYHLLLEPAVNNTHVSMELRVFDDNSDTQIKLANVYYRWVLDRGEDRDVEWFEVTKENLAVLNLGGFIDDEINYVDNVGTGYYRLQVKAVDIAGNETEIVSSPPFYLINRTPYEPTLVPHLEYDEDAEKGVIEIEIYTDDPTVDGIFKYSVYKNGEFDRLYNPISKPTYEFSTSNQYIKAKSVNIVGNLSYGFSELTILPKWFYVPKVYIEGMGSIDPVNLDYLKNELHDIRATKLNSKILTSYQHTSYTFDKIEFAITDDSITLDNIESSDIIWYSNFAGSDIEELIKSDGLYRLWVRVYNEFELPNRNGQSVKMPLEIGYGYVEYLVDNTKVEVEVRSQELIYEDKYLDLLSDDFIITNENKEDLIIKVYVNGSLVSGGKIKQDAGKYYVVYEVSDQAGNKVETDQILINVKGIVYLHGYNNDVNAIYPQYGESVNLNNYLPNIPEKMDFVGWYSDQTYKTKLNNITIGSKPVNVYAYFTHSSNYIYFDPNGGTVALDKIAVPHGQATNYLPTPIRENYEFVGWYDGETLINLSTPIYKDTYAKAKWQGRPLVVTIDEDNGKDLRIHMGRYGEPLGNLGTPVKEGYIFVGWYNNGNLYTEESVIYSDISLKAKYEKVTHQVTLHLNNGQSNVVINVIHEDKLRNIPTFTKEGHDLVGWYLDSELTKAFDLNTEIKSSFNLYAKWEKKQYLVKFNPNGGEFNYEGQFVKWQDKVVMPSTNPTRTNYTFLGWYTSIDATEPYDFNTPVTGEFSLYAKWLGNELTITFKPNNGENNFTVKGRYGEVISEPSDIPVKVGYTFLGWYKNLNDEEPFDFSTVLEGNITLEAKWEINVYQVTYIFHNDQDEVVLEKTHGSVINAPGVLPKVGYNFVGFKANGEMTNFPITVTSNLVIEVVWEPIKVEIVFDDGYDKYYFVEVDYDSILLPINLPPREGYTFKGWYKDFELTELYTFDEYVTTSFVLYAKWEINQYRIFFNTNGGTRIQYVQVEYNAPLFSINPITEKEGYEFIGWYKNIELTEIFDFASERMPANDIQLFAKWEAKQYTFTYDDGCGNVQTFTLYYGDKIEKIADPVRDGYHFAGWYLDKEYKNMYVFGSRMPAYDIVVYAKWLKEYYVTYYVEGVILGRDTITESSTIKKPNNPQKYGYQFVGWYTEPTFENLYNFANVVTSNIDLYARFELKQTTIRFETNGGTAIDPIIGYYGSPLTLPVPEKLGCTFVGWMDAYGNNFTSSIIPHDDITLYAKWEGNFYTITFDSQGGSIIPDMTVRYGSTLTLPVAVKVGFNFVGWFLDGVFFNQKTMPAQDIHLVAVWNREFTPGLIFEYVKTTNSYDVIGYTGSSASVYIPSYYNGLPVTGIRANTFANKSHVVSVTISQNVETIGSKAFYSMSNLTTILIEDGSKLKSIGTYAFQNCPKLSTLNLPNGLTSIGSYAINNTGLTSIVIPASVTSIGTAAFANNKYLLNASFAEGSKITSLPAEMFRNSAITSFVVPNSVKSIGDYAFNSIANLKSIYIPSSVTTFGSYILRYCLNIEEITLPGSVRLETLFYSSSSSNMSKKIIKVNVAPGSTYVVSNFLYNINHVKQVVLPEGLTNIKSYAFYGVTNLTSINIPSTLETIESYAFYGTSSLASINLQNSTKLKSIGSYAFEYSGITSLVIPATVTSIGTAAFRYTTKLVNASFASGTTIQTLPVEVFKGSRIESFVVPSTVTTIGDYAFNNCNYLKTLVIPSSVKTLGSYILRYSLNLTELTIPGNFAIEPLFYSKSSSNMSQVLAKIIVANGSTTVASNFVNGLTQVKEVIIPEGVTSIGSNAFNNATNLAKVNMPNSVTSIGSYAFQNTKALTALNISKDSKLTTISSYAFSGSAIKAIYIPKGVTSVGTYAFHNATALSDVQFDPDIKLQYISAYMFYNAKALKTINLPATITEIRDYAFYGSGLEKITIPYGVTKISDYAFASNASLKEIHIPVTVTTFGSYILRYSLNIVEITVPGHTRIEPLFYDKASTNMSQKIAKVNVAAGSTYVTSNFINGLNFVKEVVLPEGITTIKTYAFSGATGLVTINIPSALEVIESYAFYNATSLGIVAFGNNSKLKSIGSYAFEYSGIISLVIPASVTSIGTAAFRNTTKLLSASFEPGTKIQSLPAEVFKNSRIDSFVVPSTVTTIGDYAFNNCVNLKKLVIPSSVTTFGSYILRYSLNITELTVPGHVTVESLFYSKATTYMSQVLAKVIVADGSTTITSSFINGLTQVKEVIIPNTVISIGSNAFNDATNLVSVNIPNSVTSIGSYAFQNTKALTVLIINKESNLKSIGSYAFSGSGIKSIYIPKGVTSVGTYAFNNATALNEVKFDPEIKLTYISAYMFYNAKALKGIELPNTITEIRDYAFYASGLEKITIPSSVTKIADYAFSNNASLKEIHIPVSVVTFGSYILRYSLNIEEITIPGHVRLETLFYDKSSSNMSQKIVKVNVAAGSTYVLSNFLYQITTVKEVVLPESVKNINSYAFYGATNLTTINIPANLETIDSYAFYSTSALNYINLTNSNKLRSIGSYAFEYSAIINLVIPATVTSIGTAAFRNTTKLVSASFASGTTIQTLPAEVFKGSRIESFVVPSTVTTIGDYAFNNCNNLKRIVIPKSVTTFGSYILRYSLNITELTVPGHVTVESLFYSKATSNMSQVLTKIIVADGSTTVIANFIKGLTQVKEVILPESISSIGSSAFSDATNLVSINLPNKVTSIGSYAFQNTKSLTVFSINKDSKLTSISSYAFSGSAIKSIFIPKGITTVGTYAFNNATALSEVKFDPEIKLTYISAYMFYNAKALKTIELPATITEIREYAFYASGLTTITVPNGVTKISDYAFGSMSSLKSIHIPVTVTTFGTYILRYSLNIEEITLPGHTRLEPLFNDKSSNNMSQKIVKVNVAAGSTYVVSNFLYQITTVKEVVLPEGITSIKSYAFYGVTNLTTINIPTTLETIESYAFYGTSNLATINLQNSTKLKSIGSYAFENSGITSLVIPATVTSIGTAAFRNTTKLVSASFASGTTIQTLPAEVFKGSRIESFVVPNTVKTIGDYAFNNCNYLKSIVIPSSVTTFGSYILRYSLNITEITMPGHITLVSLFYNTSSSNMSQKIVKVNVASGSTSVVSSFMSGITFVKEVVLPAGLKTINANAFNGCVNLEKIYIPSSVTTISSSAFTNTPKLQIIRE